ncbi:hypothetical protein HD806DRAFT_441502 [Xylariaceae sp. AK1471]|nr:hypothetical protein HD806DRAFT_441502 [Xylariaceae sp. AK1471]
MRADILLTALAGASSASAMIMRIAASSIHYDWDVTGWSAGCARQGCYYDFNITGAANLTSRPPTPRFKAYCSGSGEGAAYRLCTRLDHEDTDALVVAKLLPSNITANGTRLATIQVSLRYTDLYTSTTWWNFTGHGSSFYNQFVAPLQNFTITPDEITGVA